MAKALLLLSLVSSVVVYFGLAHKKGFTVFADVCPAAAPSRFKKNNDHHRKRHTRDTPNI